MPWAHGLRRGDLVLAASDCCLDQLGQHPDAEAQLVMFAGYLRGRQRLSAAVCVGWLRRPVHVAVSSWSSVGSKSRAEVGAMAGSSA